MPVGRDRGPAGSPTPPPDEPASPTGPAGTEGGEPTEADLEAQAEQLRRYLLQAPAEEVVAQHAMGMYELAVIHLSQPEPDLPAARLAIDALGALVDGLQGRLGQAEPQLREVLPQLRMAFVQIADRQPGGDGDEPAD